MGGLIIKRRKKSFLRKSAVFTLPALTLSLRTLT